MESMKKTGDSQVEPVMKAASKRGEDAKKTGKGENDGNEKDQNEKEDVVEKEAEDKGEEYNDESLDGKKYLKTENRIKNNKDIGEVDDEEESMKKTGDSQVEPVMKATSKRGE